MLISKLIQKWLFNFIKCLALWFMHKWIPTQIGKYYLKFSQNLKNLYVKFMLIIKDKTKRKINRSYNKAKS